MASSQIRWKRGDYIRLGKAIAEFNRKIKRIETEENKLYLPDLENYSSKKEEIKTRAELNRYINSLKRFLKNNAEDKYITKAGQEMTVWERRELGIQTGIAQTRLTKELKDLSTPKKEYGGLSRVEMGSVRVREIEAQLRNLRQIENKKGFELNRLKKRIKNVGTKDYIMRKAIIYRENYINEMQKYSDFDNFEKLENRMKAIKNPIKFCEFFSATELTQDLTYQSDQFFSQREFNRFLEDLGINVNENETMLDIITEFDEKDLL